MVGKISRTIFPTLILFCFLIIIYKHNNRHCNDNHIADYGEDIGDIAEREKSERRGENNLAVVVDGNLTRGSVGIRGGNRKLTARGG